MSSVCRGTRGTRTEALTPWNSSVVIFYLYTCIGWWKCQIPLSQRQNTSFYLHVESIGVSVQWNAFPPLQSCAVWFSWQIARNIANNDFGQWDGHRVIILLVIWQIGRGRRKEMALWCCCCGSWWWRWGGGEAAAAAINNHRAISDNRQI